MKSIVAVVTLMVVLPFSCLAIQGELSTGMTGSKSKPHSLPYGCKVLYAPLSAVKGVSTEAVGVAIFQMCELVKMVFYEVFIYDLEDSFMAHIHLFPTESIGVWLQPVESKAEVACLGVLTKGQPITTCPTYKSGKFNGLYAKGTITPADLSGANCLGCITPNLTFETLMANIANKQAYVNIHTKQNLGGEISGIIKSI